MDRHGDLCGIHDIRHILEHFLPTRHASEIADVTTYEDANGVGAW